MAETEQTIPQGIVDFANRLFNGLVGFDMPALVFSDEEPPTKDYPALSQDLIWKMFRRLRENQLPVSDNDVCLQGGKSAISGIYDSSENKITIYEKAFEDYSSYKKEAVIRMTIAHEYFHAVHHFLAKSTYSGDDYYSDVVREALADFFSYMFAIDECSAKTDNVSYFDSQNAALERYDYWVRNILTYKPYPNAIFHMYDCGFKKYITFEDCEKNYALAKFNRVLNISKTDMKDAHDELVPPEYRKPPVKPYPIEKAESNYTVVVIEWHGSDLSFLFDPTDFRPLTIGEEVIGVFRNGHETKKSVKKVMQFTKAEYEEYCKKIHYSELQPARRP